MKRNGSRVVAWAGLFTWMTMSSPGWVIARAAQLPPDAPANALAVVAGAANQPAKVEISSAVALALAERFSVAASIESDQAEADPDAVKRAAIYAELAMSLAPAEPRMQRQAVDLYLADGRTEAAWQLLDRIRKEDPKDEVAAIRFLDLTVERMELAEERLAYLARVAQADRLAPPVRAHAAKRAADLLMDRAEDARAAQMIDLALQLNPQSVGALESRLAMVSLEGNAEAYGTALLDLLSASPSDAGALISLARLCGRMGIADQAANLFNIGAAAAAGDGMGLPIEDQIDMLSANLLADAAPSAATYLEGLHERGVLLDPELMLLRAVALARASGSPEELRAESIVQARRAQIGRVAQVSKMLAGDPEAEKVQETLPDLPLPDVVTDAAKIMAEGREDLRPVYAGSVKALLDFELLFTPIGEPIAQLEALTNALKTLVGDADPLTARYDAVRLLRAGRTDEARPRLEAAAGAGDRFARATLLTLDAEPAQKLPELQALMDQEPDGLEAVIFLHLWGPAGVKPTVSPVGEAFRSRLDPVVSRIETFFNSPTQVYLLRARPLAISHSHNQPVLAEVTITNMGSNPVTIGPRGMIRSTLVFDAQVRGFNAPLVAVGTSNFWGRVKLGPREAYSQVFRVDGGTLTNTLSQMLIPSVAFNVAVLSNPVITPRETVPGVGGQRASVGTIMERRPTLLDTETQRAALVASLSSPDDFQRMQAYMLVGDLVPQMMRVDQEAVKQFVAQLKGVMDEAAAREQSPGLQALLAMARAQSAGDETAAIAMLVEVGRRQSVIDQALILGVLRELTQAQRAPVCDAIVESAASPFIAELAELTRRIPDPKPPETPATPESAPTN